MERMDWVHDSSIWRQFFRIDANDEVREESEQVTRMNWKSGSE